MAEILHELLIKSTPEKAYRALTEQKQLAEWWTRDVVAEPIVGLAAQFGFSRRKTVFIMTMLKLEPNHQVVWRCEGGHPEWKDTVLTFTIDPVDQGVRLFFRHEGWKSTEGTFARSSFDWARYLISLKEYLASGRGTPHSG